MPSIPLPLLRNGDCIGARSDLFALRSTGLRLGFTAEEQRIAGRQHQHGEYEAEKARQEARSGGLDRYKIENEPEGWGE